MKSISEETLSAYIDGELSSNERLAVDQALADSPDLRAELNALKSADEIARAAFIPVDEAPMPAGLEALIRSDSAERTDPEDNVVPLPTRSLQQPQRNVMRPAAIAASVVLSAVLVWQTGLQSPAHPAQLAVAPALTTEASGYVEQGDDWRMEILATRETAEGDICRDLMLHTPEHSTEYSACLQSDQWQWQQHQSTPGYVTATAGKPAGVMTAAEEKNWLERQ